MPGRAGRRNPPADAAAGATRCARASPHTRRAAGEGRSPYRRVCSWTRGATVTHTPPCRTQYYNTRRGGLSAIILYTRGYCVVLCVFVRARVCRCSGESGRVPTVARARAQAVLHKIIIIIITLRAAKNRIRLRAAVAILYYMKSKFVGRPIL